jgi:hypothetical protein
MIAEFLLASVLNPEVGKNGAVHVAGDQLTWREAVHAFENVQEVKCDM